MPAGERLERERPPAADGRLRRPHALVPLRAEGAGRRTAGAQQHALGGPGPEEGEAGGGPDRLGGGRPAGGGRHELCDGRRARGRRADSRGARVGRQPSGPGRLLGEGLGRRPGQALLAGRLHGRPAGPAGRPPGRGSQDRRGGEGGAPRPRCRGRGAEAPLGALRGAAGRGRRRQAAREVQRAEGLRRLGGGAPELGGPH
mmetsp:Transcript_17220/g.51588  ORF Transcript_17220/g.51588 Transcript_17220/m.51588 type:complete len:201 (+) Transcript_17220:233-835(+)